MYLLGKIIKTGIRLGATREETLLSPVAQQRHQLRRLLLEARDTAIGKAYGFHDILTTRDLVGAFQQNVPIHDYDRMYNDWWSRARADEMDVAWPGQIPWFAVSSGTSGAASKYIPVTPEMIRAMKKVSVRMFCDLSKFDLSPDQFTRQMLMVGSCTQLSNEGEHQVGDMSGIIGLNRPFWIERYYRPGKHITDLPEWDLRIEKIAEEAPGWDIGFIVGNVAWVQLIFEKIIERHGLKHIHEIWPNFRFLTHGGIFFEPYRATFEQLIGHPVTYMDSYMASEGFIGYQTRPDSRDLKLITDCRLFYEFVPFDDKNFDENGDLLPGAAAFSLEHVEADREYAILLTTPSGAWRYLLGDTVRFTDLSRLEFKVTGRVKHFLSVVGEHLSVDNMNEAIRQTDLDLGAGIKEFAVMAVPKGSHWAHQWYISTDNPGLLNAVQFAGVLDQHLQEINDDYRVERRYALKEVRVELMPHDFFYRWLESQGKMNGQAKVPRVLKGAVQDNFQAFLRNELSTH